MNNRVPLTVEEQQRRAAALSRYSLTAEIPSILQCERQNGNSDDRKVVLEDSELGTGARTQNNNAPTMHCMAIVAFRNRGRTRCRWAPTLPRR